MRAIKCLVHKRIGVSGPGSVGKSVLSRKLSVSLGYPLIPEGVSGWFADTQKESPWRLTIKDQSRFQLEYVRQKIKRESALCEFVSDRTVLDAVILSVIRGCVRSWAQAIQLPFYRQAKNHAKSHYDLILVPSDSAPIGHCEIRYRCPSSARKRELQLLKRLLEEWDLNWMEFQHEAQRTVIRSKRAAVDYWI